MQSLLELQRYVETVIRIQEILNCRTVQREHPGMGHRDSIASICRLRDSKGMETLLLLNFDFEDSTLNELLSLVAGI